MSRTVNKDILNANSHLKWNEAGRLVLWPYLLSESSLSPFPARKRRIFELYLNVVEWGRSVYGAETASRYYFSKPASDLNVVEGATLGALLPSPRNPREKGLLNRRNLILTRMVQIGYLSEEEFNQAKDAPLGNFFSSTPLKQEKSDNGGSDL